MEQETSGYRRFKEKYGLKTDAAAGQTGGGWSRFKQKYGLTPKNPTMEQMQSTYLYHTSTPEEREKMRQDAVAQVGAFAGELVSNAGKVSAENKPMLDYQEHLKQTGQAVDTSKLVKGSAEYNAFLDGFYRWQGEKYLADASASTEKKQSLFGEQKSSLMDEIKIAQQSGDPAAIMDAVKRYKAQYDTDSAALDQNYTDNKMSYWANRMNFSDFESKGKYAPKVQSFYDEDSYYKNYLSMPEAERKPIWDTEISFADALYESVNGNYLMFIKLNNDERLFKDPMWKKLHKKYQDATTATLQMSQEERQVFNYVFETEGVEKAIEFLNDMAEDLDARFNTYWMQKVAQRAKEDPFWESLGTVAMAPMRAIVGGVGMAEDYLSDGELEKDAWYSQLNRETAVTRGTVGNQIRNSWAGDVGAFLYDAGMSVGDNVMNTVAMGGNQWLSALLTGSDAAVNATDDALNRGLSSDQAMTIGILSGIGETLMEKVSLGTILDKKALSGNALKNIIKSAGVEGLEEVSTELWNTVADVIIAQDKSKWQMAIDSYKEKGLSEGAAFWRAVGDKAVELGYNFLAGATAGGMMSGGNLVMNAGQVRQSAQTRKLLGKYLNEGVLDGTLTSEQIQGMVNEGLALGKGTGSYALAEKIQTDMSKGKMPKGETLAQLVAQSYTDADGKEGAKPVSIPQIDTKQQAGSNPASGVNVRQGSPVAAVGENPAPDMVAPEAMDADGGLVPGAVHMKPEPAAVQYDFDEVYHAATAARENGTLPESRYEEVLETLGYLQNDMTEGNLTEESYQATLAQVMDMVRPGGAQTEHRAEAEGLTTNVPDETWQTGQELAKALGRDIIFYRGSEGENGKYSDGKIYVNLNASDPVAQVIAHELTHSIEGTKHYDRLKRFVLTELARQNVDIAQARKTKYDQYKSQGVALDSDAKIDAEIVAEFVQNRLLTNEADIRSLVQAEPGIAKRFWDKIRNWGKRMFGSADSRTVARLEHMEGLYRKAFAESNKGGFTPGSVAVQDGAVAQAQTDSVTEQRRQTEEAYARGELTDEEYDAAMDEFDRAEEERLGRSAEKFSFDSAQKNTAGSGGVRYNMRNINIDRVFIDYGDTVAEQATIDRAVAGLVEKKKAVKIKADDVKKNGINSEFNDRKTARQYLKGILEKFMGDSVCFVHNNQYAEAYLTRAGVDHSVGGVITAERAEIFDHFKELIKNAEYAYSSKNHEHSNANKRIGGRIDWDCFVAVAQVGNDIYPVVFKIRTIDQDVRSQIYEMATKNEVNGSHDPGQHSDMLDGMSAYGVVPSTSENKIPQEEPAVNSQFSLSSPKVKEQGRPLEGWYDSDEKQLQAQKAGYPVLKGEQVVPYATWVRSEERGNYGLVTGKTDDGRLLVSFHNKHDGSMARDVALHPDMLTPVEGAYQMTKEEFASLMESEPLDVSEQAYTAEEVRELEELFRRSGGEENGTAQSIDMAKLPRKAQKFLNRAKRRMLSSVRKALGVSKFSDNQQIQEAVEQMCREYLTEGRISPETVEQIFQQAYENGIMINREMVDQFQDVRDQLRGTAVTLSDTDKSNIPDFGDFRKRNAFRLRIVDKGGMPVDSFYISLNDMAPALFPESITHPADQLVRMAEVAQSLAISKQSLDEYHGPERESFKARARNDFECAASELMNDLYTIRRYAEDRSAEKVKPEVPKTAEEALEVYRKLKKARRQADKATAKNLLTEHDQILVGRLLRHEIELQHLDPDTDNVEGITAIYEAKREYEELSGLIAGYKRSLHSKLRQDADKLLETANTWKDKKAGILYARETMERNVFDIVKDRQLAQEIVDAYFTPVHKAEAAATRMKNEYRNRIRVLNLSRKATDGNLVSEAHAVQLLGEAEDNIRLLENARGRIEMRDGKTLEEWRAVVAKLWAENPKLDKAKIRDAVSKMRDIYDELFVQMNRVRVANGYEPINYRSGYFPHFQPGESDGVLAMFGRALGIDTQVVALPTTINGLTHTFKPGMQWFGNAQERLGFNTAYDAVEGFDKYIEGAAGVIHQTENIQRLRALATQIRYRTSEDGLKEQVDAVWADDRLTDEEKQIKIQDIYANGKYTLGNFVAELDEYTNLLANKKSKYDRSIEALMGRRCYTLMKWLESRVGANMIAGNVSSALTNFIPLTQAGARLDKRALMKGMWQTLKAMKTDDGMVGESTFLTNRRGSDPLVQTWGQKASSKVGWLMEHIDQFVSGSVVRGAYYHNTKRGMSHQEAVNQADSFAAGVMADRSKGAMPTLFQSSNPIYKLFTQFQLEVNNQFSEVFKDLPRSVKGRGVMALSKVLFQYFIGAWLFNELFEKLFGRRPALDPIDLLLGLGKDMFDEDVGFGEGISNFGKNALGELPFSSGLTLFGMETDGGRFPVSSAIPNVPKMWEAVTEKDWSGKKRFDTFIGEAQKPLTYLALPFGGNQAAKIYKGMEALIRGGSYSVDKDGNDILQYPVYNDTFGDTVLSALRALIMGKSSLPEAQDWVENGFDSLGAKETSVYKAMLEAGVQDREAFGLIQELGAAKKSGDKSREAVQREMLMKSDAPEEAKALAYFGLLASDSGKALMMELGKMEANLWEVSKVLISNSDANKLTGAEASCAKRDAIANAALTDEEKVYLYEHLISESRVEDYKLFQDAGLDFGQFVEAHNQYARINGMDMDTKSKATAFSHWVENQGFTAKQEEVVRESFRYYMSMPVSAGRYEDLLEAGLTSEDAYELSERLDDLEPETGTDKVTDVQRWRACVEFSYKPGTQLAALAGVMDDAQLLKARVAYEMDVNPDTYVTLKERLPEYDLNHDGSMTNAEVKAAVDSMKGLSYKQKAVLWQLNVNSKSAKNNPYSTVVGQQVLDAKNEG